MNFYLSLLCFIFTISFSIQTPNHDLRIVKRGLEDITANAAGLVLFVKVNNTSDNVNYHAELVPDRCCLKRDADLNCDVLQVIGDCVENIPKGEVATFKLVVPAIYLFERHGHCTAYLDTKDENKRNIMRNNVKIPFDTRINNISIRNLPYKLKTCTKTDQDPLNHCDPVNCKAFYNDKRPFYSAKRKRCVDVPSCVSESNDIPSTIYDPTRNTCIDGSIITDDIEYLKHNFDNKQRVGKDFVIMTKFTEKPQYTGVDDIYDTKPPYSFDYGNKSPQNIFDIIKRSGCGLYGLCAIITFQCCVICSLLYYFCPVCRCRKKKTIEDKFLNVFRQEASDVTPLMEMTDETDTTGQFRSDSSNIDRKIHCYKACQKENQKTFLSDDILSKCVNRRNWNSRSEANKDNLEKEPLCHTLFCAKEKPSMNFESEKDINKGKLKPSKLSSKISTKTTIRGKRDSAADKNDIGIAARKTIKEVFDSKKSVSDQELKTYSCKTQKRSRIDNHHHRRVNQNESTCDLETYLQEKEIKCYNFDHNVSSLEIKDDRRKTGVKGDERNLNIRHNYSYNKQRCFKDTSVCSSDVKEDDINQDKGQSYKHSITRSESSKVSCDSSSNDLKVNKTNQSVRVYRNDISDIGSGDALKEQASAQASFNDSIDDFLSERGMIFVAGENISKYTFSDHSLGSMCSSRTSKNNMLKNVISFLKRERPGPSRSSEPGKSRVPESVNLELIHMSRATMYSSSLNENDCLKSAAEPRHSTTSI